MRAEDLMVGGWVYSSSLMKCNNKGEMYFVPFRILHLERYVCIDPDSIDFDTNGLCVKYESLLPIPITPEILEKNGFEKNGGLYLLQGITYRISLTEIYDGWWDLDMSSLEDGSECRGKTIQYIHQLQHFMRDFEIEKEVSL